MKTIIILEIILSILIAIKINAMSINIKKQGDLRNMATKLGKECKKISTEINKEDRKIETSYRIPNISLGAHSFISHSLSDSGFKRSDDIMIEILYLDFEDSMGLNIDINREDWGLNIDI